MKRRTPIASAAALILAAALLTAPSPAAAGPISPEGLKDAYDDINGVIEDTNGMLENARACEARGVDKNTCAAIAIWCYLQDKAIGKLYPGFVSKLKIFDAFKIDCGKGECYQCCKPPNGGCHTSFIGFPVINCNELYGKGTRPAGITLIVDPNAKPGASCLFTPQTCDHIPACHYGTKTNIPNLITLLNSGKPHALNWKHSKSWKLRTLAKNIHLQTSAYINGYSSQKGSLTGLAGAVTGRGCKSWHSNVHKTWPMDWKVKEFEVKDKKTGKVSESASKVNWLVQLLTLRTLAALPNLEARMNVVEAMVYTAATKKVYMGTVTDPDAELLKHASPHALAILKRIYQIQDYKMLAVPVKGEPSLAGTFNGCSLGQPPQVKLSYVKDGNLSVKVTVSVADPEYPTTKLANPLIMIWGDGTITRDSVPAGQSKTISHTYALGGKYAVYGIAANDSGLRGITALALETKQASGVKAAPADIPAIGRVVLEKFAVTEKSLSGNDFYNHFELWMVDGKGKERRIGITAPGKSKLNATTAYGDLTGHNNSGLDIKKLVLRPYFSGGFAIGLSQMYVTTDKLRFDVFNTEDGKWISSAVYLKASDVKVYLKGATSPVSASTLGTDSKGRLKLPLFAKKSGQWTRVTRIDIDLTKAMFSALKVGPTTNTKLPVDKHWIWVEPIPGKLKVIPVCGNTTVEAPEACDDGNLVSGDGCSATCTVESTPAGVTSFTAKRAAGAGAIVEWTTTGLANCKEFTLLRCQGRNCTTKTGHAALSSFKAVPCQYGAGAKSYSYLEPTASQYLMVSYYLRQHGAKSGAYTDHGPAVLPPPQPDMGPPDMSPPDQGVPDLPPPDLAVADQAVPDQTASDQAAAPDKATTPDKAPTPDTRGPDALASHDQFTPDRPPSAGEAMMIEQGVTPPATADGGCEVGGRSPSGGAAWLLLGLLGLLGLRRRG